MQSLFLSSGIQYLTYELPAEFTKSINAIAPERRATSLGVWSQDSVKDAKWVKWRLTRRERVEDSGEFYELMLAVDTSPGPRKLGFISEDETKLLDEPFRFQLQFDQDDQPSLVRVDDADCIASFGLTPSMAGGELIKVALVLDVGNSRTMGLLVDESHDAALSLKDNVFPFVLQGKEDPAREERIFSTDMELASSPLAPPHYPSKPNSSASGNGHSIPLPPDKGFLGRVKGLWAGRGNPQPMPEPAPVPDERVKHSVPFARDLSFVRLGVEADLLKGSAQNIDDLSLAQGYPTGMSSPKRYLWDDETRPSQWFVHNSSAAQSTSETGVEASKWHALSNQRLLAYISAEDIDWPRGKQITKILQDSIAGVSPATISRMHQIDEKTYQRWRKIFEGHESLVESAGDLIMSPPDWPALSRPAQAPPRARYPRRTAMLWLLFDLFARASEQINSPQFRSRVRDPHRRRQLGDIVITFPACMPPEEKERYRLQATKALGILVKEILPKEEEANPPVLHWDWDEARAAQMVFLYAATRSSEQGEGDFFDMFGRDEGESGKKKVRLATLDIGGGTSDLAIVDHQNLATLGVSLKSDLVYQDGLRIGGDNVIEALISQYVLPIVAKETGLTTQALNQLIEGVGGWTDSVEVASYWRRRWMRSVWVPVATELIARLAKGDDSATSRDGFKCRSVCRDALALSEWSRAATKAGTALSKSLDDLRFPMKIEEIDQIISQTLERDVSSLCGATIERSPDFVVVSGRITAVPAVRNLILRYLPISSHRVVFLHGYPVGDWYPRVFRDPEGRIVDSKSAVAVGATIGVLAAKGKLENFSAPATATAGSDPGHFWGSGHEKTEMLIGDAIGFSPTSESEDTWEISPAGGAMRILRKRDNAQDALAEAIYEVRLKSNLRQAGEPPQYKFKLVEASDGTRRPVIDEVDGTVVDQGSADRALKMEDVVLRFKTLDEESFSLDSGEIKSR